MSAFYNCPRHGRFPITAVYPELTKPAEIFSKAKELLEVACPKCGKVCPRCKGCGSSGAVVPTTSYEPIKSTPEGVMQPWNWDLWYRSTLQHCPDCKPGYTCTTCGRNYSVGL